jgi:hypothetical protein
VRHSAPALPCKHYIRWWLPDPNRLIPRRGSGFIFLHLLNVFVHQPDASENVIRRIELGSES